MMRTKDQLHQALTEMLKEDRLVCRTCPQEHPAHHDVKIVSDVHEQTGLLDADSNFAVAHDWGDRIDPLRDPGIEDSGHASVVTAECQKCNKTFSLGMTDEFVDFILTPESERGNENSLFC